ncbi:SIR2 family protein [Inconstantimicrobium porci]|nr:SIR2 family protein [Inconstantimicrobium porci]
MEITEAIKHIIDGNAILFLGAGFSADAINIDEKEMGDAKELSYKLCDEMNIDRSDDLGRVSQYYINLNKDNEQALVEKLQNSFICKSYRKHHEIIADLPWKRIYTTNYDDVFEKASRVTKYNRIAKTLSNSTENISNTDNVIHLNGYIRTLDVNKLENEFKLITRSYMIEEFKGSNWYGLFNLDISNADAIIFIGTSLKYDIDLQRIFFSYKEIRDKVIFIDKEMVTGEKIDIIGDSSKNELGRVFKIGVENFAKEIEACSLHYKKNEQPFKFRCFLHINDREFEYSKVDIRSLWDLLVIGKIKENVLYSNYTNNKYIFERDKSNEIEKALNDEHSKVIIVHSNLANGKTCFVKYFSENLKKKGNVFFLDRCLDYIDREINEISKIKGMKYIIIENYNYYLDILKKFKPFINSDYKFILTCRTYINESVYYKLNNLMGINENEKYEFSLNGIGENERKHIISLLDESNIWSDLDVDNVDKKNYLIKKICHDNLADVLLYIVKSEVVSSKIKELYEEIAKSDIKKRLLLGVIINTSTPLDLKLSDLILVLGMDNLSSQIKRDKYLNELVDIEENNIKSKSSIFSKNIIATQNLSKDILSIMKDMIINASKLRYGKGNMNILRQLISISNINEILDYKNKQVKRDVVEYFDELKNFNYYKNNNFFWLQYAMACLDDKQYDRASKYFDISYKKSFEKNPNFDTYQIDTQYARYLLEKATYTDEYNDNSYEIFKKAHNILVSTLQKKRGQSYYVFRQVPTYYEFIQKHISGMLSKEKNDIKTLCEEMKEKIEEYLQKNKKRDLEGSVKSAMILLDKCIREIFMSVIE